MNSTSQAQGLVPEMSRGRFHGQEAGGLGDGAKAVAMETQACSQVYPPHPPALAALLWVPGQPSHCRGAP